MVSIPKHLVFDVDGVLTDGKFYYTASGKKMKAFGCQDSDGVRHLKNHFKVQLITADRTGYDISRERAFDMGLDCNLVLNHERAIFIGDLAKDGGVIFMGDALTDIPAMRVATLALAPANCRPEVKPYVDHVTEHAGGSGAVLDACLFLLARYGIPNTLIPVD